MAKTEVFMRKLTCKHQDRHNSKIICGYPLPCPYHTVIININAKPVPTLTIPITADAAMKQTARERLAAIGLTITRGPKRGEKQS